MGLAATLPKQVRCKKRGEDSVSKSVFLELLGRDFGAYRGVAQNPGLLVEIPDFGGKQEP
jgi:hypothetical protein